MNKLDHVVTNNINNKYPCIDNIEYGPKFYGTFIFYSGNKDTLPVVTVRLRGGKKHRATIIYCLKCLWGSGATDSMIKSQHAKPYEHKMCSNKV